MSWITGLSGRAWLIIAAVVAFAAWSAYLLSVGYSWADSAWQAKALEAKIAKLELEIKLQAESDAEEDRLRSELEDENKRQKKVIDDFLANNEKRTDKCPLGDDADKLNGL